MPYKRLISVVLCMVLCLTFGFHTYAQKSTYTEPEVSISSVNFVKAGEVCQINIFVYNLDAVAPDGGKYCLRFALPDIFTLESIYKNGNTLSSGYSIDSSNTLTIAEIFNTYFASKYGKILRFTLLFKVNPSAKAGKYDIDMLSNSNISDKDNNKYSVSNVTNGFLRIASRNDCIAGDTDGNEIIDSLDMLLLKKTLLGKSASNRNNTDTNGDGITDLRDMIYLKKYFVSAVDDVYLSSDGDDRNSGSKSSPVRTLNKAIDLVKHGGKIYIIGKYEINKSFKWNHHSKAFSLVGGELDITDISVFELGDSTTFEDIKISVTENTDFYACGYTFNLSQTADFSNTIDYSDTVPENNETSAVVTPTYDVNLEKPVYNPINQQMGMAIYHFSEGEWDTLFGDRFGGTEKEFLTYYRSNSIEELLNIRKKDGLAWWLIGNPFTNRTTTEFREGWAENILMTAQSMKEAGVWDVLAGFETEELCLAVTQEQFRTLTGWLRDNFPDKRIFSCLSMYEVRGTAPSGFTVTPMSYDTYAYITDIGYDWYSHLDEKQYRDAVELMLTNMGRRNNVRIWFFPTSCNFNSYTVDEAFVTDHLNLMYKLLLEQENPGGLYLYTWMTWGDNPGMADLLDPSLDYQYNDWGRRIVEIGKEMRANSYRYIKPFN